MSFQSRADGLSKQSLHKPNIQAHQAVQPQRTSLRLYGFRVREDECYYGIPIPACPL